jgi:hypothetical protein
MREDGSKDGRRELLESLEKKGQWFRGTGCKTRKRKLAVVTLKNLKEVRVVRRLLSTTP